jgi:hypothetical protein
VIRGERQREESVRQENETEGNDLNDRFIPCHDEGDGYDER